jgi:hypothetical protein
MRSPLHLLCKESAAAILKVLVLSILYWMFVDPEMHACTSHVISTRVVMRTITDGRMDRRTDDRTMAAGLPVTWTHCSVRYEVTRG